MARRRKQAHASPQGEVDNQKILATKPPSQTCLSASSSLEIDKIKNSRFIAYASPAASEADARAYIAQVARLHPKRNHACWAYRESDPGNFRVDDDGEPGGTAGRPILQAIDGEGLSAVVVVVVRYFGGQKLGTGGLVRAYGGAARALLRGPAAVHRKKHVLCCECTIVLGHCEEGKIRSLIQAMEGRVIKGEYDDKVALTVIVPQHQTDALKHLITDALGRRVILELHDDE